MSSPASALSGGRGFCRAQIVHSKAPRYVRLVNSFPATVTGTAQKFLMPKAMMEEVALKEEKTPLTSQIARVGAWRSIWVTNGGRSREL